MTEKSRMALPRMHGVSMNACIARSFLSAYDGRYQISIMRKMLLSVCLMPLLALAAEPEVPSIAETMWVCHIPGNPFIEGENYKFAANGVFATKPVRDSEDGWMMGVWKQSGNVAAIQCCDSFTYKQGSGYSVKLSDDLRTLSVASRTGGSCYLISGNLSRSSEKSNEPSASDEALKQMRDPFGRKQPASGKRESGLADPFKKDVKADQETAALRARGEEAKKLDLTKSTWSPAEAQFDPRHPYPAVFHLIAPNGGFVLAMSISIGQVTMNYNVDARFKGTLTVDVVNVSPCTLHLSGMLYSKGTPIKDLGDKNIGPGNRIVANGPSGDFSANADSRLVFRPSGFLHDCQ